MPLEIEFSSFELITERTETDLQGTCSVTKSGIDQVPSPSPSSKTSPESFKFKSNSKSSRNGLQSGLESKSPDSSTTSLAIPNLCVVTVVLVENEIEADH